MSPTTIPGKLVLQSPAANDPLLDLNTQPSLDLQFATSKTLDDRVSGLPLVDHQRDASGTNSPGTYVDSTGVIRTSKVNLLNYSEDLSQWTSIDNATLSNAFPSPKSTTASRLTSTTSSTWARAWSPAYSGSGVNTVGSVYLRADTPFTASLRIRYDSVQVSIQNINVTTDWQRFSLNATGSFTAVADFMIFLNADGVSGTSVAGRTLDLWGAQLEEGSTPSPYIKTTNLPSAAPRFDHDPSTNASLGFLIEESRENLIRYSEEFDQTGWFNLNLSQVNSGVGTAPDGQSTAYFIAEDSSSNIHVLQEQSGWSVGNNVTLSVFAKASTRNHAVIGIWGSGGRRTNAEFNLDNGTVRDTSSVVYSITSTNAVPYGNNWWKLSISVQTDATNASVVTLGVGDGVTALTSNGNSYTGDNVSGVYLWGAQVEAGSFPTSYIPTSGSTVTRAADVASITGSNFSSWYNQSAGTVFIDFNHIGFSGNQSQFGISDGTNNNSIRTVAANGTPSLTTVGSGINNTYIVKSPALTASTFYRFGVGINATNAGFVIDGGTVSTDTTSDAPAVSRLIIGNNFTNTNHLDGHISRLTYYPYRLADATLQTITS